MGARDSYRRREPVAPAVGDRPSIGDRSPPGKAHCARRLPAHPPGHHTDTRPAPKFGSTDQFNAEITDDHPQTPCALSENPTR